MAVPRAIDRKYTATICVWNCCGASLVVTDRPGGEMNSSASVNTSSTPASAKTETVFSPLGSGRNSRNAAPISTVPMPNFTGVDGCRDPIRVHTAANTGASVMMKTGLIDWTQDTGIVQSP